MKAELKNWIQFSSVTLKKLYLQKEDSTMMDITKKAQRLIREVEDVWLQSESDSFSKVSKTVLNEADVKEAMIEYIGFRLIFHVAGNARSKFAEVRSSRKTVR